MIQQQEGIEKRRGFSGGISGSPRKMRGGSENSSGILPGRMIDGSPGVWEYWAINKEGRIQGFCEDLREQGKGPSPGPPFPSFPRNKEKKRNN